MIFITQLQTESEYVSEFSYQPGKCEKAYRIVVLKKKINVIQGILFLFDDIRYFFHITNDLLRSTHEIVQFYRKRADHENDIEQRSFFVINSLILDLNRWPNKGTITFQGITCLCELRSFVGGDLSEHPKPVSGW